MCYENILKYISLPMSMTYKSDILGDQSAGLTIVLTLRIIIRWLKTKCIVAVVGIMQ